MKKRLIAHLEDAIALEKSIKASARKTGSLIAELHATDPIELLWQFKFQPAGCDPLDSTRPLNLIEQINQTFTCLASARAATILFELHPEWAPFTLNLGTAPGTDIESVHPEGIACEVFASVNPSNNRKLVKDIEKVGQTRALHKYVFFMSPGFSAGRQTKLEKRTGVQVWALDHGV